MDRPNYQRIPPRWLKCPRKSGRLVAGKFLAFKTPLGPMYDDQVPEEYRFPPSMLLASMNSYSVKMGLWIDLTFTSRFYDKKEIEDRDIKYLKLQCRGHGESPDVEQTRTFIEICSSFIKRNPQEVIGIHCTHGFNRSGFLIAAYLVENLSWSVEAAVREFTNARPPGIYKADYLRELYSRYEDASDIPPPPPLPDWCMEYDERDDDGGVANNVSIADGGGKDTIRRRGKEFNKKNPIFMEGVSGAEPITTQPKLLQIQRKVQDMCGWHKHGFPGLQLVSMDNANLGFLNQKAYKVSWKADGTRYMMLIDGENEVYFVDRDNCVFQVTNIKFPRRKEPHTHLAGTLLDGEMVIDKVNGLNNPRYLVYDIVKFEGQDVGKTDFDRRLLCIRREIIEPRHTAIEKGLIDKTTEPFGIRAKDFWDVITTKDVLSEKFMKQVGHEIDGLVFQSVPDPYTSGRCPVVLKWKPPHLNSVDFKLHITKEHQLGMLAEYKGLLYVGGQDSPFDTMKVTKDLKTMDKKIIECTYSEVDRQWKFLRERTDKSFPNSYDTAMGVCNSIRCPVTKEKLLDFIERYRWQPNKRPLSDSDMSMPPAKKMAK